MNCPSCKKENAVDAFFCTWCDDYMPSPGKGKKANLFARWVAWVIDPAIAVLLWLFGSGLVALISPGLGLAVAILFPLGYFVWWLMHLKKRGQTVGKRLLGLQVVTAQTGQIPGFGTLFIRVVVGRIASGLFFGLGYFWAIIDKNGQAWHDKIAGTVVVKTS